MIRQLPRWVWLGACLLPFAAGMVNAVAFLGFTHDAVSHATGNTTRLFIGLARPGWPELGPLGGILLAFLAGAVLSGIVIGNERLKLGRHYGIALILESGLLALAYWLFGRGHPAGEYCAAAACGLQNAMVATYSGSVIRTTHVTGILSDVGAWLGCLLRGQKPDRRQLALLLILFFSFGLGGTAGAFGFDQFRYRTLLAPSALSLLVGVSYLWYRSVVIRRERAHA